MPVALFVCPHCEKHAEVQVTSVTRSRPCPHCGEAVVLQVAGKGKRRALLVNSSTGSESPSDTKAGPGPAYEPMPLEGDVFERMKHDPEIQAFRRKFVVGLSVVASILVVSILWHFIGDNVVNSVASATSPPTEERAPAGAKVDPAALPSNTVGMRRSSPDNATESSAKLVFEPSSQPTQSPVTGPAPAQPAPAPARSTASTPPAATPPQAPVPAAGIEAKEDSANGSTKVMLAATDPRVLAAAALERFLLANNIDAMLATVADRQKVEPKIRQYLGSHPITPLGYRSLTISNGAGPTGERGIVITMTDGTTRDAVVVREDNRSVVDWPSFVAWSDMEWAQFMEKKPVEPVLFRVIAEPDQRFDNAFSDPKSLACLKLSDPRTHSPAPIFAYVERTSVIGQEIETLMRQSAGKPTKLTLHLKYPIDSKSQDQVWIDDVLANGWMLPREKSTAQAANSTPEFP